MDSVYGLYNNNSSLKINLNEYFKDFSRLLIPQQSKISNSKDKKESIMKIMNVNIGDEELNLLSQYCSIDNLTVPGEVSKVEPIKDRRRKNVIVPTVIPPNVDLKTVQNFKEKDKSHLEKNLPYDRELSINYKKMNNMKEMNNFATQGQDFLVFIRIYEPFTHTSRQVKNARNIPKAQLNCMMSILGQQTLAQLRDKIKCVSDLSISTEISNQPNTPIGPLAKDVYKSGFFYIEDTFYNDIRDPKNLDYSHTIIKWAESKKLGPFKTASMQDVQIGSLCVRFGYPWVYQHQGSCEHLIIFSNARMLNTDDELCISAYPRIEKIRPRCSKYCMMCGLLSVKWICTDSNRIPHNPAFFCDNCFKSYNYIDGKKVGDFKAYRYPCDPSLLEKDDSNNTVCEY